MITFVFGGVDIAKIPKEAITNSRAAFIKVRKVDLKSHLLLDLNHKKILVNTPEKYEVK